MKKLLYCACVGVLASLAVSPCFAADSPWNGTWKINLDKSKMTGDTFTITSKPDGMMHYSNGSTLSYDFACDGKPHSTLADRTVTCTGSTAAGLDYVVMASGTMLSKSHRMFSADGKTMTIKGTSMHADGTTTEYTDVYKRESGTAGLVGKWENVKVSTTSELMKLAVANGMLKLEYPQSKEVAEVKLDGTPGTITGPTIPPGAMVSYKAEGPMKIHWQSRYHEKVLDEGIETLSADGKTIMEEEWEPGKISEKATLVWEKQ